MEQLHRIFDECPACKSKRGLFKSLTKLAREKKFARDDWNMSLSVQRGAALDEDRAILLPIGASVPVYSVATEVCIDCGCIYASHIDTGEGKVQTRPLPSQGRSMTGLVAP